MIASLGAHVYKAILRILLKLSHLKWQGNNWNRVPLLRFTWVAEEKYVNKESQGSLLSEASKVSFPNATPYVKNIFSWLINFCP